MLGTALEPPIPDLALVQAPVAQKPETLLKLQVQPEDGARYNFAVNEHTAAHRLKMSLQAHDAKLFPNDRTMLLFDAFKMKEGVRVVH
mmetsp:Transcript_8687/g.26044  ORF Transcript_8687/g.26044 Transcript_8687/m.26044 type:complete len:88 (-) Transcript_8687:290-553(-)